MAAASQVAAAEEAAAAAGSFLGVTSPIPRMTGTRNDPPGSIRRRGLIICAAPIATTRRLGSRRCRVPDCRRGESEPDDASNAAGIAYASGNRTDPAFHYAKVCKSGSCWEAQQIQCVHTPAYTGEKLPMTGELDRLHVEPCRGGRPSRTLAELSADVCNAAASVLRDLVAHRPE